MAVKKKLPDSKPDLKKHINMLQAELDEKNKLLAKKSKAKSLKWKAIAASLCVAVAAVLLLLGNIFFWAGNTVVNTDKYVATVGPLIQKPQIQTAVAQYTTTQIFSNNNVVGYVQKVLPPKAEFLAPQLTSQLKGYTQSTIKSLLASSTVQKYWYSSLTRRHQALISFSKNYTGNGSIDVSDLFSQLDKRLAGTRLSFLANKQLPPKVGSIQVTTVGWLPAFHKLVNNIGLYQTITTFLFLGFSALSVWLAKNRRKMIIMLGLMFTMLMIVTILALKIAGSVIVNHFNSTYQSAVQVAYNTVDHSLIVQTLGLLLISILMVFVAWITGPYKSSVMIKSRIVDLLSGKLHTVIFGDGENGFTRWVSKYKTTLQWLVVAITLLLVLILKLSPKWIIVYALLMLVVVLVIQVFSVNINHKNIK